MTFALDPRAQKAGSAMATWAWARAYRRDHGFGILLPARELAHAWVGPAKAKAHAIILTEVGFWRLEGEIYVDVSVEEERTVTRRDMERGKKARWRAKIRPPAKVDTGPGLSTGEGGLSTGTKVDTSTGEGGPMVPQGSPSPSLPLALSLSSSPPPIPSDKGARTRGTRLSEDFQPSEATLVALRKEGFADPLSCLPSFRDYWAGCPGAKGRKLDWDATYRNWVRNDRNRSRPASNMHNTRIVQQAGPSGPAYELGFEGEP